MLNPIVPFSKIGTPFQSPDWRTKVLTHPERFGFTDLCSKREPEAGHLKRLIPNGLRHTSTYTLPVYIKNLVEELPSHLSYYLLKTWNKYYFREHRQKINFATGTTHNVPISWNMKKINVLNDDYLKKMLRHFFHVEVDEYITEAIKFRLNMSNIITCRFINYMLYCNVPIPVIAKKWNKPVKMINALKFMYYDYSHWPDDRLVRYSILTQLRFNEEIDDQDMHVFKRIFDLGEIGLKSLFDMSKLELNEQNEVIKYLEAARVENTLNLKYTISNYTEAVAFTKVISDYAGLGIKRKEAEGRLELLKLTTHKAAKELGMSNDNTESGNDIQLINDLKSQLRDMTLVNPKPVYPSFITIKQAEVVK